MYHRISFSTMRKHAFTLVEVVLALGIFLVTVLALVGLLGPTLKSVSDVEDSDEVISVVNTLNAFLQNSPEIAGNTGDTKFQAIYEAVANDGFATVFVFKAYQDQTSDVVGIEIGFDTETQATVTAADFNLAAGQIYRVVLTPSSVIPVDHRSDNGPGNYPRYTLNKTYDTYPEGYFAMEARIFARDADMLAVNGAMPTPALADLNQEEPIFSYNTAIVR